MLLGPSAVLMGQFIHINNSPWMVSFSSSDRHVCPRNPSPPLAMQVPKTSSLWAVSTKAKGSWSKS